VQQLTTPVAVVAPAAPALAVADARGVEVQGK
jgi:hypothetical protein